MGPGNAQRLCKANNGRNKRRLLFHESTTGVKVFDPPRRVIKIQLSDLGRILYFASNIIRRPRLANDLRQSSCSCVSTVRMMVKKADPYLPALPCFRLKIITLGPNTRSKMAKMYFQSLLSFYTAQVKELCSVNELLCVILEKKLNDFDGKNAADMPSRFRQLLRFLRAENGVVIQNFWQFAQKHINQDEEKLPVQNRSRLEQLFNKQAITNHYRFQTLTSYFGQSAEEIAKDPSLNKYLQLALFFAQEQEDLRLLGEKTVPQRSLREKTTFIIERLKAIVCDEPDKSGVFFIVRYKRGPHITYQQKEHFVAHNSGLFGHTRYR